MNEMNNHDKEINENSNSDNIQKSIDILESPTKSKYKLARMETTKFQEKK